MKTGEGEDGGGSPRSLSRILAEYVNTGCFTRTDRVLSLLSRAGVYRRNAERVIRVAEVDRGRIAAAARSGEAVRVQVPPYVGNCPQALSMRDYLAAHVGADILAGIVHGSIATGEEVGYSDFDALVILRDEVLSDPRRLAKVALKLEGARSIMNDFDPLQHHGWFVVAEHQLRAYPESYLPTEVLRRAKALLPSEGVELGVSPRPSSRESLAALNALIAGLVRRIERKRPADLFELKGLLSQFMLLPALYVQARDGRGVFKKESFALAKVDFDADVWAAMDEVSEIRARWVARIAPVQRRALRSRGHLARRLFRPLYPAIPAEVARRIDADFYGRVLRLTLAFREAIASRNRATEDGAAPTGEVGWS